MANGARSPRSASYRAGDDAIGAPPSQFSTREESGLLTVMTRDEGPCRGLGYKVGLWPGAFLTAGSCSCADCGPDLVVDANPGVWFKAAFRVFHDHWALDNLSPDVDVWCADLEDPTQRLRIAPGRADVAVPFEFARVEFRYHGHPAGQSLTAIGHEPERTQGLQACHESHRALRMSEFQSGTTYMAVHDALCSAISADGVPPTSAEIAAVLAHQGFVLSRRAVDHHIDYVFNRLFPDATNKQARPGWKRIAIASMVNRGQLTAEPSETQPGRPIALRHGRANSE